MVTRNGSVKTPRNVDVAVDYDDVVRGICREATSDVARLRRTFRLRERSSERGFLSDLRDEVRAEAKSKTHAVLRFL